MDQILTPHPTYISFMKNSSLESVFETHQVQRGSNSETNPDDSPKEIIMNKLLKQLLMVTVLSTAAVSVFAVGADQVEKSIPLKNGTTLHILKGGKMAMEDKLGKAVSMKSGEVMETMDGKKIMMHGNELMRLDKYLQEGKGS